jgi:hypothetical protein
VHGTLKHIGYVGLYAHYILARARCLRVPWTGNVQLSCLDWTPRMAMLGAYQLKFGLPSPSRILRMQSPNTSHMYASCVLDMVTCGRGHGGVYSCVRQHVHQYDLIEVVHCQPWYAGTMCRKNKPVGAWRRAIGMKWYASEGRDEAYAD